MTQITPEQRRLETASTSVAAKLRAFQDGLTVDEQAALAAALRQMVSADDGAEDTAGYSVAAMQRAAIRVFYLLSGLESFPASQPREPSP